MNGNGRRNRVLVIRNDRLGDTILSLPAVVALRDRFPKATIGLMVHRSVVPLVERLGCFDELLSDDGQMSSGALAAKLQRHSFDAAVVLNTNTRNAMAVWRAGIPRRVCWSGKLAGRLLGNANANLHRSHPPIHETAFCMALARKLAEATLQTPPLPPLSIPADASRAIARRLRNMDIAHRPLFGIHPGNRGSAFNWPLYRYAELVRELSQFGHVVVTGGPGEEELVRQVIGLAGERGTPMTGMSLFELAALLTRLTAFVVSSTGPMHLAGWTQTPVVCLFSCHPAQVPEKWAPLGDCHTVIQPQLSRHATDKLRRDPKQMDCIEVERVLRAALAWLDRRHPVNQPA